MNIEFVYVPPRMEFDPQLADEVARLGRLSPPVEADDPTPLTRRSPFDGYSRSLTSDGGILITYKDLNRSLVCKSLKISACLAVTLPLLSPILDMPLLSSTQLLSAAALGLVDWIILKSKVKKRHSVEIRPDCMIIDRKDIFWAEDIGDNWPELVPDQEEPTKISISGICGTRYIEYMTANRIDDNCPMPEVLMAHLQEAMEQLWGRREVTFASAS
ncbi:hypothetical protein Q3C01_28110 [Bradyrhizobium sp. UFLA05-109]